MASTTNIQILLLAAGAAHRMGTPKQLLSWGTKTILQHQLDTLRSLKLPMTLVLGAHRDEIMKRILIDIPILEHQNWRDGMGTSIALGAQHLLKNAPDLDGLLIALIDQPMVAIGHYKEIIASFEPGKQQIIASRSPEGVSSPPVLFDRHYLTELSTLTGDQGAMRIVKLYVENRSTVESPHLMDIDTPEEYTSVLERYKNQLM